VLAKKVEKVRLYYIHSHLSLFHGYIKQIRNIEEVNQQHEKIILIERLCEYFWTL
jgi:hypothetical protein